MNDHNYKRSNTAFLSIVNLHLDAKHHKPVQSDELETIDRWFKLQPINRFSHKNAVQEIIELRERD